jgi:hypothetical protein
MKLLQKPELKSKLGKQNEELIQSIQRHQVFYQDLLKKINSVKQGFSKDKELQEFERFCEENTVKKSKLLKEYKELEEEIEKKKEIIFGLVEKQDELMEKEYELSEREKKLDLRENFIKNIEKKIHELQ